MPKQPKQPKRSRDPVQAAFQVYQEIIGKTPTTPAITGPDQSPVAVAKRKGAATGGEKRANKLIPQRRKEIAQAAARKRWDKPSS